MDSKLNNINFIHPDSLFIDRLSVTYSPKNKADEEYILKAATDPVWLKIWTGKGKAKPSQHYKKAIKLEFWDKNFDTTNSAYLELQPWNPETPSVRLDYNPSKISYHMLAPCLENIFPHGMSCIFTTGTVSRVDIALDIIGVIPMQVILDYRKTRHRENYLESGLLETVYLGTDSGVNQLVMYDKTAEMKAKKLIIKPMSDYQFPTENIARIELRHRPKKMKFSQLHKLPNLFAPMYIILTPLAIKNDTDLRHKRDLSVLKGLRHTANELKKAERAAFAEKVEQQWLPDFLHLDKLWATLPQALLQVYPHATFV
jgi:hypothetical protein